MVGVIIQARMGSTRLPGKSMKLISGQPLIYYPLARAEKIKYANKVVLATSKDSQEIIDWCEKNSVEYFAGSENDVLDRYYKCAKANNFKVIIRLTADNPFIDPVIIDMLITKLITYDLDYITMRDKTNTWPYGLDAEVFKFSALEQAWVESKEDYHREHVTTYIKEQKKFNKEEVMINKNMSDYRITVDTEVDYKRACILMDALSAKYGVDYSWHNLIQEYDRVINY